jgi:uncharacterized protein
MKIEREQPDGRNAFTGYGSGYVAINGERYEKSLVVTGESIAEWAPRSVAEIDRDDVAPIAALGAEVEVVLIGTGAVFQFPDPASLAPLHAARIGVEVMDTQAACRTYNILLAEGRKVVAALIV